MANIKRPKLSVRPETASIVILSILAALLYSSIISWDILFAVIIYWTGAFVAIRPCWWLLMCCMELVEEGGEESEEHAGCAGGGMFLIWPLAFLVLFISAIVFF